MSLQLFWLFSPLALLGCQLTLQTPTIKAEIIATSVGANHRLYFIDDGAEQDSLYLSLLQGKKVGLVVNQTSQVNGVHWFDKLLEKGISVQKIFAPEHGFRGYLDAGATIANGKDINTGLPIMSLYGSNKKPSANDLADIDLMVFDIQDVGVRFDTYISTLYYVMDACATYNKPLLILDRPNPNGHYVDGFVLEPSLKSFVGVSPIPIVHGLTVGEYAQMVDGEKWLPNERVCDLKIVTCAGYTHNTPYELPILLPLTSPQCVRFICTHLFAFLKGRV